MRTRTALPTLMQRPRRTTTSVQALVQLLVLRLACLAAPLWFAACATPRLDDPPLAVELVVVGLRPDERAELRDRLCAMEAVTECALVEEAAPQSAAKRKGKKRSVDAPPPPSREARYLFSYRGSLGNLRWRIQQLPHPGLEPQRAEARLSFRGFDNKAPTIELLEPAPDTVLSQPAVDVTVRVADIDTAEVEIGDEEAAQDGDRYRATVRELPEGPSSVSVKATDQAGNAAELMVTVVVDTTPPELQVEVQVLGYDKAVVRGKVKDAVKVSVDGRELAIDLFGNFQKEVSVDPDVSYTEVIAVDERGNARKIKRSVKIASPMSADSK